MTYESLNIAFISELVFSAMYKLLYTFCSMIYVRRSNNTFYRVM